MKVEHWTTWIIAVWYLRLVKIFILRLTPLSKSFEDQLEKRPLPPPPTLAKASSLVSNAWTILWPSPSPTPSPSPSPSPTPSLSSPPSSFPSQPSWPISVWSVIDWVSYRQLLSPTNSSRFNISPRTRSSVWRRGFTRLANPDSGFWDCRNSLPSAAHLSGSLGQISEQNRISGFPDILSKEKSLEVWSITARWDLETAITSSCTEKLDFESYLSWEHSTLDTDFPLDGHHQTLRQNFHYHWIRKSSASE